MGSQESDTTEQLNHRYGGDLSSFPLRQADYMLLPLNKASLSAQLSCRRSRSWPARTGQVPSRSGSEQELLALLYLPQLCFAVWYCLKVCLPPTEPHQSVGSREPGFVFVFPTTVLPTTTVLRIQSELTEVMNTLNHWKHFLKTSPHFPHPALKKESKWSRSVVSNSLWTHGFSVHGIFQARILEWVAISTPPYHSKIHMDRAADMSLKFGGKNFSSWYQYHSPLDYQPKDSKLNWW